MTKRDTGRVTRRDGQCLGMARARYARRHATDSRAARSGRHRVAMNGKQFHAGCLNCGSQSQRADKTGPDEPMRLLEPIHLVPVQIFR